jgi:methylmalonyl-CoA mutase
LISESHVAAVHDPAAGAHAVEMLTSDMAEAGWAEFQRIEAAGGILDALDDGSVRERWSVTAVERSRRIAIRKQPITGVSEFPHLREVLPARVSPVTTEQQQSVSWAEPFEQMRDAPATSPVFLATLGSVAEHGARAGFAANLFAAGGIDTVTAGRTAGVDDVVAAFTAGGTTIACLAGADTAYAASGIATATALRQAGATRVVLAGRPKGELEDAVDDHVAAGDDVVEFLRRTRRHLTDAESNR